ncbi:nuclear transport factor 2 family protein [Nocardioides humi]|uniref:SnoaL-like domain-containing protein n=1 Tax=Nocardioides humi TaxID=449461 RepID=A0ABN2BLJ1_9ACTN|nr:nuclear transport factor 2 family protein [Nocardioides humi]
MTDQSLAERLLRLEEIETARGLYNVYAETLDDPDPDTVAPLFTEDAVLHTPVGDFVGREAILDFYTKAFADDTSVKRHFITNSRVVAHRPGEVHLVSYFLYVGRGDDASIVGWGTYDDRIDVSGTQPLFREKTIDVHVGTDLSTGWAKGAL